LPESAHVEPVAAVAPEAVEDVAHTQETATTVAAAPASADVLVIRIAAIGARLSEPDLASEFPPDQAIAAVSSIQDSLRALVDKVPPSLASPDGSFDHPGADYLARSLMYMTDQAAASLEEASKTRGGGRGFFSRGGGNPWPPLAEAVRLQACATSVLSVLQAYVDAADEAYQWIRESPMFEVLTAGLAGVSRQLYNVARDPRSSQPVTVEPFFASVTDSLQTLKAVIDDRVADVSDARTADQLNGAKYLLGCASGAWQSGVDALGEGRQTYLAARERWASNATIVLDNIGLVMLHLLSGQALVTVVDVYASAEFDPESAGNLLQAT
jgi:hypothetical protein